MLDFFADHGQVVTCPGDEVEVLERALDLNVFVVADGRRLEDVWVQREDQSSSRMLAPLGMITCRYTSGADVVLLLERDGYRPKRVTPVSSLDPVLGCAVIDLVRDSSSRRVWLELVGEGPANVQVTCEVESPRARRPRGAGIAPWSVGRIEAIDGTGGAGVLRVAASPFARREPKWYVDWTMPCAGLVEGAVIPVRMVLGGRLRVLHGSPTKDVYWRVEVRTEGGEWVLLDNHERQPGARAYPEPLPPGRYELRARPLDAEPGPSVPFEVRAKEVVEVSVELP